MENKAVYTIEQKNELEKIKLKYKNPNMSDETAKKIQTLERTNNILKGTTAVVGVISVINWIVPDAIPIIDEAILTGITALLGSSSKIVENNIEKALYTGRIDISMEEIQKRIESAFVYDDYKWQLDNKVRIKSKYRAHGIHKVLYKCPHCNKDYSMRSEGIKLWCNKCGATYEMNEYGQLICISGKSKFTHAPDWYKWEREEVVREVEDKTYYFEDMVRIEHLDNYQVGFREIGTIKFVHDMNGIHLYGKLNNGEQFQFDNPCENTPSIHIDYNYKKRGTVKRGQAIDINTINDTWFIFPKTNDEVITKIHFAVEALYDLHTKK